MSASDDQTPFAPSAPLPHRTGSPAVPAQEPDQPDRRPPLSPAAERALAEAEARRRERDCSSNSTSAPAPEIGGRKGPDPVRYGDWETGGVVSDF